MESSNTEACGIGSWKPRWLQRFATPASFLVSVCMLTLADAIFFGILSGVTTSLETRYKLTAQRLGLLFTMDVIGIVALQLLIAYFGGHPSRNRPRWIAWGSVVIVIGIVTFILPQFVYAKYNYQLLDNGSIIQETFVPLCHNTSTSSLPCLVSGDGLADDTSQGAFIFLVIGVLLIGLGFAPLRPLAFSYIDDNAPTKAGFFFGIMDSMYGIGTILGLLVAAVFSEIWVDFYRMDAVEDLKPGDPGWVGAWWTAVAIAGVFYLFSSIPLFCFPSRLTENTDEATVRNGEPKEYSMLASESQDTDVKDVKNSPTEDSSQVTSFSGLFRSVGGLFCNPAYMMLCVSSIFEALMNGTYILFPKYFEEQFGITPAKANIVIAVGPVPAIFVGSIFSGYIIKRLNLNAVGASKLAVVGAMLGTLCSIAMLLLGCPNRDMDGLMSSRHSVNNSLVDTSMLQSTCNVGCNCTTAEYVPVCGVDDVTYFSPCHAGCPYPPNEGFYADCSCVTPSSNSTDVMVTNNANTTYMTSATNGACDSSCKSLIPFTLLLLLFAAVMSIPPICRSFITVRCVDPVDKSLAVGLSNVIMHVLGAIPATIAIGAVVDSTCVVWQIDSCGEHGACWVYDLPKYRIHYLGFNLAMCVCMTLFFIVTWYFLHKTPPRENKLDESS